VLRTIAPVGAESNQTWEIGYRGIHADRLYADVSMYRLHFEGFIGPAVTVANPFVAPRTYAYDAGTGQPYTDADGKPLEVRTVYNMGDAIVMGLDVGIRYYATDRLSISYGLNVSGVTHIATDPDDPAEATAFNTSPTRMNLSVERKRLMGADLILAGRYVHGYAYQSAANAGHVPTFATFGIALQRSIGDATTVLLQAENVISCVSGRSIPPTGGITNDVRATYVRDRSCGFGQRHMETPNMPKVGTMFIVGVRREWR
jgi:hypothetical protein